MVDPDERLIFLVFTAQQRLRNHLKRRFREEGLRITAAQAAILFLLRGNNGQTMSDLSQSLMVDNSSLTGMIDRLEKLGLASRGACPGDRRAYRIEITEKGHEEADRAKRLLNEVNAAIKEDFSLAEVDNFRKILRSFFRKFQL
ncbi:MAG: MarR family transcriptional regulator [Syntrophales bacterium]|nr:MarR family transcriptional regulator [Syntrophales bacterium]